MSIRTVSLEEEEEKKETRPMQLHEEGDTHRSLFSLTSAVHAHVLGQRRAVRKGLATIFTLVRSFARVRAHVRGH